MTIPTGVIIIWSSASTTIPSGWALCDGNSGTPDLRGCFIYGAKDDSDVGMVGGSATHFHTTVPSLFSATHQHTITATLGYESLTQAETNISGEVTAVGHHNHDGLLTMDTNTEGAHTHALSTSASANHLPPYYKLYYIMKT